TPSSYALGIFLPYWPMFAVGIALYRLFERGLTPSRVLGPAATPVACVLAPGMVVAFAIRVLSGGPVAHVGLAMGFGVLLSVAAGLDRRCVRGGRAPLRELGRRASRLLVALGAMSYSLFLLHGRLQFLMMQPLRQVLTAEGVAFDLAAIAA